jgi:hypothetical protein
MIVKESIDFKRGVGSKEALNIGRIMGIDLSKHQDIGEDTPPGFGRRTGKTSDGTRYMELVEKSNRTTGEDIKYRQKLYTGKVLYYEEDPKGSWDYQFVKLIDYSNE